MRERKKMPRQSSQVVMLRCRETYKRKTLVYKRETKHHVSSLLALEEKLFFQDAVDLVAEKRYQASDSSLSILSKFFHWSRQSRRTLSSLFCEFQSQSKNLQNNQKLATNRISFESLDSGSRICQFCFTPPSLRRFQTYIFFFSPVQFTFSVELKVCKWNSCGQIHSGALKSFWNRLQTRL